MADQITAKSDFLQKLYEVVGNNIANEQFGVSDLADRMHMSRSNLLRRVKKETNLSVTQLISQVRLQRAMELLRTTELNVSEVSHEVGFNSTSYFIKCFREFYGYPPGEARGQEFTTGPTVQEPVDIQEGSEGYPARRLPLYISIGIALILSIWSIWFFVINDGDKKATDDKSIAVLPFKNESSDSSNVHLINGLMDATLNNLQQISELRVISRTSVEKYRNKTASIPELSGDLNVRYFVEGSGQKIGDRIVLNIQLIDAQGERNVWSRQYRREVSDIFALQEEIARNIADEIEVLITPAERQRIEKRPTKNHLAYDHYLKGRDLFYKSTSEALEESIPWFRRAIDLDPEFALAYAHLAMVYYYLDIFRIEKQYGDELAATADKAFLYDSKSGESLVAKGLAYANKRDFKQAVPYLEKALEYNPQSGIVLHFLTEFYSIHIPHPAKYLEFAGRKTLLDKESLDSSTTAFNYFHLGNAYVQCGFLDEALYYIDKSMQFDPNGFFTGYVRAYILFAREGDLAMTKRRMKNEYAKDTSRIDLMQEVAKMHFMMREYDSAFQYYRKFVERRKQMNLDIFKGEDLRIAITFAKAGLHLQARALMDSYKSCADEDKTIYYDIQQALYYAHNGDVEKGIRLLRDFSRNDNIQYWVLLLKTDPIADPLRSHRDFNSIMKAIEDKFWKRHRELRRELGGSRKM